MGSLGILEKLEWHRGSTGYFADGTIHPLTTPGEILRYPLLTLRDKAALALLTLRARKMETGPLDRITARDFILENLGERVYASFFEPLLSSKFGERRDEISAAWLISRISIRSNRGFSGERLGYPEGGFDVLIQALADTVGRHCVIRIKDPVVSMEKDSYGWRVNDQRYDAVLSTIPPQALAGLGGPQLSPVPYQGAACMLLSLERDVTSGIYWLNMKDSAPYGAVVSHTNFIPMSRYGEHLVYLASYFQERLPERLDRAMVTDFCSRFRVPESEVRWQRMAVDPWAGPLYTTGYRDRIQPYREKGLYLAGMFSRPNYPERSMEGSVIAGEEAAAGIARQEKD